jgi:putative sigma-54 modulation protein
MKFILSTHNVTLTKAIEDHILSRIDKLEHFDRFAIDARVTLEHDHTRAPERAFKCSMRLGVRGNDLFAEDSESDLYAAIDLVTKKLVAPEEAYAKCVDKAAFEGVLKRTGVDMRSLQAKPS